MVSAPSHALVLVDGNRRHGASGFAVTDGRYLLFTAAIMLKDSPPVLAALHFVGV